MIIKINGKVVPLEDLDTIISNNSYHSIPELIKGNLTEMIHHTEWYRENSDINIFHNYEAVRGLCDDNAVCWMDAFNRSVMESNSITGNIYKFIEHRAGLIHDGITKNLLGGHLEEVIDFISWFF